MSEGEFTLSAFLLIECRMTWSVSTPATELTGLTAATASPATPASAGTVVATTRRRARHTDKRTELMVGRGSTGTTSLYELMVIHTLLCGSVLIGGRPTEEYEDRWKLLVGVSTAVMLRTVVHS